MKFIKQKQFLFILFVLVACFPIFLHLEAIPVRMYDEARLAINAYEMSESGNCIVTTFENEPDMWNTKPPLMIWLQVLFIKWIGVGELAIRLPSAIAAFLTCILLFWFSAKYLRSYLIGLFAVVVLVSSQGYIDVHVVRTGDYDSLLVLFTTFSSLIFFIFLEYKPQTKYLYLFTAGIILGVLTKGIAGLLLMPVYFIYLLVRKDAIKLFKNKHLYFNVLIFILIVSGYYVLREYYNPGYIQAVVKNELFSRYFGTIEGHKHESWFYFKQLKDWQFTPWVYIFPLGLASGFLSKDKLIKKFAGYSFLLVIIYFIIISFGQTKLVWYAIPTFPFLALSVALIISGIRNLIGILFLRFNDFYKSLVAFIIVVLFSFAPYNKTIQKVLKPKEHSWDAEFYEIGYYLKSAVKNDIPLNEYILIHNGYYAHNLFYVNILHDKGNDIQITHDFKNIISGQKYIVHQADVKEYVEKNYNYVLIDEIKNIRFYKITDSNENRN